MSDSLGDAVVRPSEAERRAWLRHLGVDWVLLHRVEPVDELQYRPTLEQLLGPAAVEDEALIAFRVESDGSEPESPLLHTFGEQGWHQPELDGGLWRRWMYNDGELYIYSTRDELGSLLFTVDSHLEYPLLEVHFQGNLLDTFVVDTRAAYSTRPITLTQGMNVFRFHAPGGCPDVLDSPDCWSTALLEVPPEHVTLPCDLSVTCRTFVFDQVSFVSGPAVDTGVNFGDQMLLRSWELDEAAYAPGDVLSVWQSWEALAEVSDRHIVFVHLVSEDGTAVAQHDGPPVQRLPSYSAWPVGSVFGYSVEIDLPADLPQGEYRLLGGVYLWPSLERLPVLADEPGDDIIELGRVRVEW